MIEVQDLVKDYGSFRAVDHLSFGVAEGEIVGFLGPNGAGKTTTIRILTGYQAANSGQVRVAGKDVLSDSLDVRSILSYLPENVPLYPDLRVQEYLRYRAGMKGVPRKAQSAAVDLAMEKAGVTEMRRKLLGAVSRGYRQRVGLADALVSDPPLLILDEPTSGLDPNQRAKIRELIRGLEGQHTVLFSSHILSDVEDVCDRIVLIHRGRKRADGTLEEIARRHGDPELQLEVRANPDTLPSLLEDMPLQGDARIRDRGNSWIDLSVALHVEEDQDATVLDEALDELDRRIKERQLPLRKLLLHAPGLEELFASLTIEDEESAA